MEKADKHLHSPFCPHGSKDSLQEYAEKALHNGFSEITFTEHAPLPAGFADPAPAADSSMKASDLEAYFTAVQEVKEAYAGRLKINTGLEVDYIEGFEEETKEILRLAGPYMDDSILSVHFLSISGTYYCMDYSEEEFRKISLLAGSVEQVYSLYYRTLHQSVLADLGPYKPKRLGHITLARKFQKAFPPAFKEEAALESTLELIKKQGMELDFNSAGLRKPMCGETYPPLSIAKRAAQKGIPLVFGSDAHAADDLGAGYAVYERLLGQN
ncbi:histidinol-phosphatase HisJ [Metabacillus sp. GX 13764]|uniref:histidinol-phosphatase HisJ n=1 Tax=Metabacillus kandeliae TaxID=2900151 RepID=UPI001E5780B9|nr:histidinol-phosphatase HisJ [Metabacillus kandeliae]